MLVRQNPNHCGYPTNDGPAESKIHGENRGETLSTANYRNEGRKKIKTQTDDDRESENYIVHVFGFPRLSGKA